MSRRLVVNADDLGRSAPVNEGIFTAHREGIVTSASLMVRWDAAADAAAGLARYPELGVGLHLDLGEWAYADGDWRAVYEVVDVADEAAVEREVRAQVARFVAVTGRPPTHIDSHQHVHMSGAPAAVARRIATELGVPLRQRDPRITYVGAFYGRTGKGEPVPEGITAQALVKLLDALAPGVTELACHPGSEQADDPQYGPERAQEVRALIDPLTWAAVERNRIELCSFADLAPASRAG